MKGTRQKVFGRIVDLRIDVHEPHLAIDVGRYSRKRSAIAPHAVGGANKLLPSGAERRGIPRSCAYPSRAYSGFDETQFSLGNASVTTAANMPGSSHNTPLPSRGRVREVGHSSYRIAVRRHRESWKHVGEHCHQQWNVAVLAHVGGGQLVRGRPLTEYHWEVAEECRSRPANPAPWLVNT